MKTTQKRKITKECRCTDGASDHIVHTCTPPSVLKPRKIEHIEQVTNEDGDVCGAVLPYKKLSRLGGLRFIRKSLKEWGNDDEEKVHLDDIQSCDFWHTIGGEHDGYIWWSKPDKKKHDFETIEYYGSGWIYYFY